MGVVTHPPQLLVHLSFELLMEFYSHNQFPESRRAVYIAFFKNVKNVSHLRNRIVKAATAEGAVGDAERAAVNFAFVEAKLVSR